MTAWPARPHGRHVRHAGAGAHLAVGGEAHHALAAAHLDGLVLRLPLVGVAAGGDQLVALRGAGDSCEARCRCQRLKAGRQAWQFAWGVSMHAAQRAVRINVRWLISDAARGERLPVHLADEAGLLSIASLCHLRLQHRRRYAFKTGSLAQQPPNPLSCSSLCHWCKPGGLHQM
jgi:hypothetical protein